MAKSKQSFTHEQITEIEAKLRALPVAPKRPKDLNKSEVVKALSGGIRFAQRNGYTLQEIAKQLSDGGVTISAATLKNYLQRTKPPKKATTTGPVGSTSTGSAST
jgi:hypothetical protein